MLRFFVLSPGPTQASTNQNLKIMLKKQKDSYQIEYVEKAHCYFQNKLHFPMCNFFQVILTRSGIISYLKIRLIPHSQDLLQWFIYKCLGFYLCLFYIHLYVYILIFVCTVLIDVFILFIGTFTYGNVISYWWPYLKKCLGFLLAFHIHWIIWGSERPCEILK